MKKRRNWTQAHLSVERLECRALLATVPGLLPLTLPDAPDVASGDTIAIEDSPAEVTEVNRGRSSRTADGGGRRGDGPQPVPPDDASSSPDRPGRPGRNHNHGSSEPPDELLPPSLDGTGNNTENADFGVAGTQLLRLTSVEYADGISEPAGDDRPTAREVSNAVVAQSESIPNDRGMTSFVWFWGQFIDHDISLTHTADQAESFPIEVPAGDAYFDPAGTGSETIDLDRSEYNLSTGDSLDNPRQQVNTISAFIDGSAVYGSELERADALRTFEGGRLKTSEGDLLPFNEAGLDNAGGTSDALFLAGDVRANENTALTAVHTLWVREHNRIADEIAATDPSLSDEQIYQQARRIVTAEIQAITYNEFLPAILGTEAISPYTGYDPTVDPGISNIFSTAIYRFGHSTLTPELLRLDNDGNVIDAGNLSLREAFFAPDEIVSSGIDSLLQGGAAQLAQKIDTQVVDDVRNFLFGEPGAGGFDLSSLNIQRGRDHGLPNYNQARVDMGLEPVGSFVEITSDPELQAAFEEVYGDVNGIDVWVGALAEDHVPGASMGELSTTVMVDQFERLRDGDRFWYQHTFHGRELQMIENTTLADVIQRNTDVTDIQDNVFFEPAISDPLPNPRDAVEFAGIGLPGQPVRAAAGGSQGARVTRPTVDAGLPRATNGEQRERRARDEESSEGRHSRRDRNLQIRDLALADLDAFELL